MAARPRSRQRAARSLALTLATAALVFAPFALLAWHFGPLTGDLARIGAWSERDYGWRAPQPALAVRSNRAAEAAPDVLVLGDSFAMGNVWQSVAAERLRASTFTLGYDGHGCLREFAALALSARFASARHVVVETIERHLLDRFEQFAACGPAGPVVYEGPPGTTATERPRDWPTVDWRYVATTAVNTLRVREAPSAVVRGLEVVNVPLASGALFSSRESSRLLYYVADENKALWDDARIARAARNALELQGEILRAGKTFTLLVIPDKSTVYRDRVAPGAAVPAGPDFEPAFRAAGVHLVSLRGELARASAGTVDLYLPDDTHLSPRGFEIVGLAIADRLGGIER